MFTNTLNSFLGRNSRAINSWSQTFEYEKTKPQPAVDSAANTTMEGNNIEPEEVMMVEVTWMQPYLAYMLHKTLPEDIVEALRIVWRSKAFVVVRGELYKKSISVVLQRCVTPQEGQVTLHDFHA
jgi:hypothetical protein